MTGNNTDNIHMLISLTLTSNSSPVMCTTRLT